MPKGHGNIAGSRVANSVECIDAMFDTVIGGNTVKSTVKNKVKNTVRNVLIYCQCLVGGTDG